MVFHMGAFRALDYGVRMQVLGGIGGRVGGTRQDDRGPFSSPSRYLPSVLPPMLFWKYVLNDLLRVRGETSNMPPRGRPPSEKGPYATRTRRDTCRPRWAMILRTSRYLPSQTVTTSQWCAPSFPFFSISIFIGPYRMPDMVIPFATEFNFTGSSFPLTRTR